MITSITTKRPRTSRRPFPAFLSGALFLAASGCSPAGSVGREILSGQRPGAYIPGVPMERQMDAESCGANALAALLGRWGIPASQKELHAKLHVPSVKGSLTVDLWREARARGLWVWERETLGERDLLDLVGAGIPPLVLTKRRSGNRVLDHFVVLTGFDARKRRWIAQAGLGFEELLREESFRADWSAAGRWVLVAAPPDGEAGWFAWAVAEPDEWRCRNNLAEARIGQGRLDEAERYLARALELAPTADADPAAWAHLADTQGHLEMARGRPEAALPLFCEALRHGRLAGLAEEDLRAIRARRDAAAALTPSPKTE